MHSTYTLCSTCMLFYAYTYPHSIYWWLHLFAHIPIARTVQRAEYAGAVGMAVGVGEVVSEFCVHFCVWLYVSIPAVHTHV